mgnify:CR=1 FL=1
MDIEQIKSMYKKWQDSLNTTYQKMWDYYTGKTDIESTYKKSRIGNNRIIKANFIRKFINEEVAFATGNPITYTRELSLLEILNTVENPEDNLEIKIINNVMVSNNSNVDSELMKNLLVFGSAMELYYINNNTFKIKELNPLNCYVNLDAEGQVIDAIYVYKADKEEYIEYFDSFKIYKMDKSFDIIEEKDHYFGCCPISYCSLIDGIYNTLFTDLKYLQDNIENVLSDFTNEIGDSRLSYLILKNMGLDSEEIEAPTVKEIAETIIGNFRDNGILLINDSKEVEAKAEYLVKSINPEIHNKLFTILQDTVYQLSQHINLNEQQSSNTSGVALMTRIIALRNKVKIQQNCMTKAIRSRLSCMFTVLNKLYGKDLDSTKVGIKYTLNVPSDDAAVTDIINKLVPQGILSAETGLAQLSFINNPKQELEKAKAELEEKENMINGLASGE